MEIPAPNVPAHTTLPLYDLPESPPANGYTVERLPTYSRKSVWKRASYCTVKSQSIKGSFIDFQMKVENLAVVGDLPCFFAWPCDSGNHPAKFN